MPRWIKRWSDPVNVNDIRIENIENNEFLHENCNMMPKIKVILSRFRKPHSDVPKRRMNSLITAPSGHLPSIFNVVDTANLVIFITLNRIWLEYQSPNRGNFSLYFVAFLQPLNEADMTGLEVQPWFFYMKIFLGSKWDEKMRMINLPLNWPTEKLIPRNIF